MTVLIFILLKLGEGSLGVFIPYYIQRLYAKIFKVNDGDEFNPRNKIGRWFIGVTLIIFTIMIVAFIWILGNSVWHLLLKNWMWAKQLAG